MVCMVGDVGVCLGEQCDRFFVFVVFARYYFVFDLRVCIGLMMWEVLCCVFEGGVWVRCEDEKCASDLGKCVECLLKFC